MTMSRKLHQIAKFVQSLEKSSLKNSRKIKLETISLTSDSNDMSSHKLEEYLNMVSEINMKSFCKPLEDLGVCYFQYVRRSKEKHYLHLSNFPEWLNHFFEQKYYLISFFDDPEKEYTSGNYLWQGLPNQQTLYQDLRDNFKIDYGITCIQKHEDCDEFFYFGADKNQYEMPNFYLNHFYLLERFILYFKDNFMDITEAHLNKRVIFPARRNNCITTTLKEINKSLYFERTNFKRYYLSGLMSNMYLTRREVECLKWHIEGKTGPEIATILRMSSRTVETHLNRIRSKTNCFSRGQLCTQFAHLQI